MSEKVAYWGIWLIAGALQEQVSGGHVSHWSLFLDFSSLVLFQCHSLCPSPLSSTSAPSSEVVPPCLDTLPPQGSLLLLALGSFAAGPAQLGPSLGQQHL